MNAIYKKYKEKCSVIGEYYGNKWPSKVKGALSVNIFKEEAEKVLKKYNLENEIEISENNSYILGQSPEFDLLFLKKNAEKVCGLPMYNIDDVLAIMESKTVGVVFKNGESENLKYMAEAFNNVWELNPNIRFGYATITEKVPANPTSHNSWENTCKHFDDYIYSSAVNISYASALHHSLDNPVEFGTEEEWEEFVLTLVGKCN